MRGRRMLNYYKYKCNYKYSYCFVRVKKHYLPSTAASFLPVPPPNNNNNNIYQSCCTWSYKIPPPSLVPIMSLSTSSTHGGEQIVIVVVCGKSSEDRIADSFINKERNLKLPTDLSHSIRLYTLSDYFKKQSPDDHAFQVKRYMGLLTTDCFGRFLLYSPRLSSTQHVVSHNFSELPLGAVCVADTQFQGKGRTNNVWESPKGCLMFSFTLQMENGRILPFLQYLISLAMVQAVKALCQHNGIQNLDLKIKWPNDLYLDGQKVGGILCTSTYRSKRFDVSAGIGLNVANEKPSISLNSVVQRLHSPDQQLLREDIMATFFNEFEKFYSIFKSQGFQPFEELYCKTWLHSDQRVIVQDGDTESVVTIQGITSEGYLLAVGDDGERSQLHPDGNSFDFFRGLVRRKLT